MAQCPGFRSCCAVFCLWDLGHSVEPLSARDLVGNRATLESLSEISFQSYGQRSGSFHGVFRYPVSGGSLAIGGSCYHPPRAKRAMEDVLDILDWIHVGITAEDGWRPGRSYKDGGLTAARDTVQK